MPQELELLLVDLEVQVLQEPMVLRVQLVPQELELLLVDLEVQVLQEPMDLKVQQEQMELELLLVELALLGPLELLVILVPVLLMGQLELTEQLEIRRLSEIYKILMVVPVEQPVQQEMLQTE